MAAQELLVQRCLTFCATSHFEKRRMCLALLGWKFQVGECLDYSINLDVFNDKHGMQIDQGHTESSNDRKLMMQRKAARATR